MIYKGFISKPPEVHLVKTLQFYESFCYWTLYAGGLVISVLKVELLTFGIETCQRLFDS